MNVQSKSVNRPEYFEKVDFPFQGTPCSSPYAVLYIRCWREILMF